VERLDRRVGQPRSEYDEWSTIRSFISVAALRVNVTRRTSSGSTSGWSTILA